MTREDVISWLEYLSDDARSKADSLVPTNIEIACGMAIDALNAQQPHLLTLDEIHDSMVVWLEERTKFLKIVDDDGVVLAIGGSERAGAKCFITVWDVNVCGMNNEYNVTWRAWSERPTKEQREREPWNRRGKG